MVGSHLAGPGHAHAGAEFCVCARDAEAALGEVDLSCLQHAINAAEPVDAAVIDAFERFFGAKHALRKGVVFPTYGLAESTVLVCGNGVMRCTIDADALRGAALRFF